MEFVESITKQMISGCVHHEIVSSVPGQLFLINHFYRFRIVFR